MFACGDLFPSGSGFYWGLCLCCQVRSKADRSRVFKSNGSVLVSVTERSCMRLHEDTKLLLSESGNLYLALQVARYGLCLGALQFRLQCVLLHEGGEWG